jgi:hypothetical protein
MIKKPTAAQLKVLQQASLDPNGIVDESQVRDVRTTDILLRAGLLDCREVKVYGCKNFRFIITSEGRQVVNGVKA